MSQALYQPWPAKARRTWGWGAIGIVLLTFVLSALPIFLGAGVVTAVEVAGGASEAEAEARVASLLTDWLLATVLVQFLVWASLVWMWARAFERRPSATFGLRLSPWALVRYLIGLPLGLALVFAIGQAALLLGASPGAEAEALQSGLERLTDPVLILSLVGIGCVFLVQGGAEEIIFRGWLMSTLSARWGVRAGVIVSSLVFMIFHAHVFISGVVFGLVALMGLGLMGLVFALLSLVTRSVVEAIAAHGAFNAAAIIAPVAVILAQNPERTVSDVFSEIFTAATGTGGADSITLGPEMFAQSLAAGALAAVLAVLLVSRRRSPPWREEIAEEA